MIFLFVKTLQTKTSFVRKAFGKPLETKSENKFAVIWQSFLFSGGTSAFPFFLRLPELKQQVGCGKTLGKQEEQK